MKNLFAHLTPLSHDEIKSLWGKALIIPDTNVLLNAYRYSQETFIQLESLFLNDNIRPHLWAPYQVLHEFHKDRISVILDQQRPLAKIVAMIDKHDKNLTDEIAAFGLHRYHPFIDKKAILALLSATKKRLVRKITGNSKAYPDFMQSDPWMKRVQELFAEKHGQPPTPEEKAKLIAAAKERYEKKTPPGYMDAGKEGGDPYGDFFIWMEIIGVAKAKQLPVIFVTDDAKEDWWLDICGRTIGARPELRKEFTDQTAQVIHFYSPSNFLEHAARFIGETPDKSALAELENMWSFDLNILDAAEKKQRILWPKSRRSRCHKKNVTIGEMVSWFYDNYKDPAEGVPYDSSEGGYMYIAGGPYDPVEELYEQFPNADSQIVEEAARKIYSNGVEWVKNDEY